MHCEWNYGPGKVGIGHDLVKGSGHAKPPDLIVLAGRNVREGEPRQQ